MNEFSMCNTKSTVDFCGLIILTGTQTNKTIIDFQIFPSSCCPYSQTKHAHCKGQALLLSHLTGQAGTCIDKMCHTRVM